MSRWSAADLLRHQQKSAERKACVARPLRSRLFGAREDRAVPNELVSAPTKHDAFLALVKAHGLPLPETEVIFHTTRKWKADYLWRAAMVIVEREGGIFMTNAKTGQGAHSLPTNILRDMEKGNAAQVLGYLYLRFTPRQLNRGDAMPLLAEVLR